MIDKLLILCLEAVEWNINNTKMLHFLELKVKITITWSIIFNGCVINRAWNLKLLKSIKYACIYALKKVQICFKNIHLYLIFLHNIFRSTNIL